jgi:hypothetical protein
MRALDECIMSTKLFFKISLFLPIVFSLIAIARPWFTCLTSTEPNCLNMTITDYELFIGLYPIMFGGIPYLIFLVLALIWLSRISPVPVLKLLIGAPLVYTGIFVILIGSYYLFLVGLNDAMTHAFFLGIYTLAYGYLYVIVTGLIWLLVKRTVASSNKSLKERYRTGHAAP